MGPIVGVPGRIGKSLNVHVNSGTAFMAPTKSVYFYVRIIGGFGALALVVGRLFIFRRR